MSSATLTYIFVAISFGLYAAIAVWARAGSTKDFYVANSGVGPIANGMATAADWMSAASFISLAGIIAFMGYGASVYLLGWTGGYVILALMLAPYLRKFGKFTVPDFIASRYYSRKARMIAVIALIIVSFTYIAGQMRGVGIVFSHFLDVPINTGVYIGMSVVFIYAVLGGMKGITYTQVAQYCIMIFAYLVPAIYISIMMTGSPVPQFGLGGSFNGSEQSILERLDGILLELGFQQYTTTARSKIDMAAITMALMLGTAGLPHVIVRFFTVPKVSDARKSAAYALLFIAILYTTAPAVGAFARLNFIDSVHETHYEKAPNWVKQWEGVGLIAWIDKNNDGIMQYGPGKPFEGRLEFSADDSGPHGERVVLNKSLPNDNEVYVDRDIMVLANPEIASLPPWVIALVAAGGLAAALSTAAGLLLVISSSISHDLVRETFDMKISDKTELLLARLAAALAIFIAGYLGINPPGFVAEVVALAFGLAASSLFPPIVLGIFSKRINNFGAISGMVVGLTITLAYIVYFKFFNPELNIPENWWFEISPEGFGVIGAIANFLTAMFVSKWTEPPKQYIRALVDNIRLPN
ncbi:MAG: sodium:solute symporter family protein [Pseudomonadota bacterium]|nr:sodium:solute symporter family protein [Pseudomonadota bacterium]